MANESAPATAPATVQLTPPVAAPETAAPAAAAPPRTNVKRVSQPVAVPVERDNPYDLGDTSLGADDYPDGDITGGMAPAAAASAAAPVKPSVAPPAVPASSAAPAHPAWLLRQAEMHGLLPDEIAETPTEQLKRDVQLLDRQAAMYAREMSRAQTLNNATSGQNVPPQAPQAPPKDPIDEFDLGISKDQLDNWDPELVRVIKTVSKGQADKIAALEQQLGILSQREQHRENETLRERLDRLFDSVPQFADRLGAGDGRRLSKEHREERRIVVATMIGLQNTFRQNVGRDLPEEEVFQMALRATYGGDVTPARTVPPAADTGVAPTLAERRNQWSNSTVARPASRADNEEPKGEKRAVQKVAQYLKEHGHGDDDTDLNGFPG